MNGPKNKKYDWEAVDWSDDNDTIARQVGASRKAVAWRRTFEKAGPASKSLRQKQAEARWAGFLRTLKTAVDGRLVFRIGDANRAFRKPDDTRQRSYDRARRRLITLRKHGLVRYLGGRRNEEHAYMFTTRAALLLKAYELGDRSEWDALTDKRRNHAAKRRR